MLISNRIVIETIQLLWNLNIDSENSLLVYSVIIERNKKQNIYFLG